MFGKKISLAQNPTTLFYRTGVAPRTSFSAAAVDSSDAADFAYHAEKCLFPFLTPEWITRLEEVL